MTQSFYSPLLGEMICDPKPSASSLQGSGKANQLQALAEKLGGHCSRVSNQVESADRAIEAADRAIRRAHQLGLYHHQFAIGPIAIRRLYGPNGPPECIELTQPAVTTEFGCVVAVVWSSDDYQEWRDADEPYDMVAERCVPLRDCGAAVRVRLIREVPELLRSLLRGVEQSRIFM
ncbi:hypothetical protein [Rhodopirellula baltica]|uniref:Uncharacterized protein n=1 Tax=Rhodopirellula baltica WH47 TaxID=991778 RepID=F2ALS7_RHOBT|nr:hypothetical protein [Rhodopirellula baltica]EGF29385.1 hypothetical protein RBWH47_00256 [Rhodopirellula baltica WH47]